MEYDVHCLYQEYGITAEFPFEQAKIVILGDKGVGKTSTRKRLCGDGFDQKVSETEGIELTKVNCKWNKVTSSEDAFQLLSSFAMMKFLKKNTVMCIMGNCVVLISTTVTVLVLMINDVNKISGRLVKIITVVFQICLFKRILNNFFNCQLFGIVIVATGLSCYITRSIHYILILFLYDGVFVNIKSINNKWLFIRGGLLGFMLMIHQVKHHVTTDFEFIFLHVVVLCAYLLFEWLLHCIIRLRYSSIKAYNIYLIFLISFVVIIKSGKIFNLSQSYTVVILRVLYISLWANTHGVQLNLSGRSIALSQTPYILFFKLFTGVLTGVMLSILTSCMYTIENFEVISVLDVTFSIFVFSIAEVHQWWIMKRDIPVHYLNDAAKVHNFGDFHNPYKRWIMCDFAGDQMYYDTHQVFIPRQGIFLVVFDASHFKDDNVVQFNNLLCRVQFWVQSIAMKSNKDDSAIFIVGTHAKSVTENQQHRISQELQDKICRKFNEFIVFNKYKMVFFIENKDDVDEERAYLKAAIEKKGDEFQFLKDCWPVKYHLFQRVIAAKRTQKQWIVRKSELKDDIVGICRLMNELGEDGYTIDEKIHSILKLFQNSGDIFYETKKGTIGNEEYVIVNLEIIIDIVNDLAKVPFYQEGRSAEQLNKIKNFGIVDHQLLIEIFEKHYIKEENSQAMINVLLKNNILFLLSKNRYRLLTALPHSPPSYVEPTGNVIVFYTTFSLFRAEYVFLNLISILENLEESKTYRDVAEFKSSSKCRYVIRVQKPNENLRFTSETLKITIKCEDYFDAYGVILEIRAAIECVFESSQRKEGTEEKVEIGLLCGKCGTLLVVPPDFGKGNKSTFFPDMYHTVKITRFKETVECTQQNIG